MFNNIHKIASICQRHPWGTAACKIFIYSYFVSYIYFGEYYRIELLTL